MSDFTLDTVTDDVRNMCLEGELGIQVLQAGPMASTGSHIQDAANTFKKKNHIAYFAGVHSIDVGTRRNTIHWSMDVNLPAASIGSDEAQYHRSSDRSTLDSLSSFDAEGKLAFSETGSIVAPPSIVSGENVAPPPRDNNNSSVPSSVPDSGGSQDARSHGTDSAIFATLPEGPPADGELKIKIRNYGPSDAALKVFTFRLIGEPTFGQFLDVLVTRGMFPFKFRKFGFSYSGCRHFAAEAFEAWKAAGLVEDVCTTTQKPLRQLLGVRYSPLEDLPLNPEDSDDERTTRGVRHTTNKIDRGSFTDGFVPLSDTLYPYA